VRVRFEDDGATTRLRARFWPEAGIEPDVWTIDASSAGPGRRARGGVALGGRASRRAFADLRVVSLVDGQVLLDERFDDPRRFARDWVQRSALGRWLASPAPGAARVVLAHDPDVVLDAIALGHAPDLVVAGHTHGGQVRLPGIGPVYVGTRLGKRFDRGAFRLGEIPLIITSGVGTSVLPLRLGVPPEVAIIDLVPLDWQAPKEGS
jgi:predicted MPP superfamily phosphohydrolase